MSRANKIREAMQQGHEKKYELVDLLTDQELDFFRSIAPGLHLPGDIHLYYHIKDQVRVLNILEKLEPLRIKFVHMTLTERMVDIVKDGAKLTTEQAEALKALYL
jgi:hypothetical protein